MYMYMYTYMHVCMFVCMYVYIYIYIYIYCARGAAEVSRVRPLSLLIFVLLRFLDSNFPGDSLWAWQFHPSIFRFYLSQAL